MTLYDSYSSAGDPGVGRDPTKFYAFDAQQHADAITAAQAAIAALGPNCKYATVAGNTNRAAATYAASGGADTVTLTPGASGLVLVLLSALISNSLQDISFMSVALSGGNTVAAIDANSIEMVNAGVGTSFASTAMGFLWFSGLAAASTVFTPQYKANSGTSTFSNRKILAIPFP